MAKEIIKNPDKTNELLEKILIVNLYLAGANRNLIKSIVGVGTKKPIKLFLN